MTRLTDMPEKEPSGWHSLGDIYREGIFGTESSNSPLDWRAHSFDSPLEFRFAYNLMKYLHHDTHLDTQVSVETITGTYRLDFVAHREGRKVAVECDGKDFHDEGRDEWRDAMILGAEAVDVIYRFRGRDINYHIEDCLFVVSQWEPHIFSLRGLLQLNGSASDEARHYLERNSAERSCFHNIIYKTDSEWKYRDPPHIFIVRNSRHNPPGDSPFWQSLFKFAQDRGGGNLDNIISRWNVV